MSTFTFPTPCHKLLSFLVKAKEVVLEDILQKVENIH